MRSMTTVRGCSRRSASRSGPRSSSNATPSRSACSASLVQAPRWDQHVFLREEKAALGFYLSGHPFTAFRQEIGQFVRTTLDRLTPSGGDNGGGARTALIPG